jgi:hypothetical protein
MELVRKWIDVAGRIHGGDAEYLARPGSVNLVLDVKLVPTFLAPSRYTSHLRDQLHERPFAARAACGWGACAIKVRASSGEDAEGEIPVPARTGERLHGCLIG